MLLIILDRVYFVIWRFCCSNIDVLIAELLIRKLLVGSLLVSFRDLVIAK